MSKARVSPLLELAPALGEAAQLIVLLHGVGGSSQDLLALAHALQAQYPLAAVVLPQAPDPMDGGHPGWQWFSVQGINDANRPARVRAARDCVLELLAAAQARWQVPPPATTLGGFSQGAILALEAATAKDGAVGRVLAFAGRYASPPAAAPAQTTIHLLHGADDPVIAAAHAQAAYEQLAALGGDVTIDIAKGVGHELHPALVATAIRRLQTCIPLRLWQQALGG